MIDMVRNPFKKEDTAPSAQNSEATNVPAPEVRYVEVEINLASLNEKLNYLIGKIDKIDGFLQGIKDEPEVSK